MLFFFLFFLFFFSLAIPITCCFLAAVAVWHLTGRPIGDSEEIGGVARCFSSGGCGTPRWVELNFTRVSGSFGDQRLEILNYG
jgi:hypothetical protein